MWNLRRKHTSDCHTLQGALESSPGVSALSLALREHLAACPGCRLAADESGKARALLGALPSRRYEPSPWFVGRVMSAISAREAELRRSMETWTLIPRLAVKLTWVSALALLLAGTWIYERPKSTFHQGDSTAGESLFESPSPAVPDDLLASIVEQNQ